MKIVVEVTSTGVNVYCEHAAEVAVFDIRELNEDIDEIMDDSWGAQKIAAEMRNDHEKALTRKTIGLIQVY